MVLGLQGIESPMWINQSPFFRAWASYPATAEQAPLSCFTSSWVSVTPYSLTGARPPTFGPLVGCCIDEVDALGVGTSLANGDCWDKPPRSDLPLLLVQPCGRGLEHINTLTAAELLWPSLP